MRSNAVPPGGVPPRQIDKRSPSVHTITSCLPCFARSQPLVASFAMLDDEEPKPQSAGNQDVAPMTMPAPPVNVSAVPQRSPFRYPGGKTWLVPQVRQWLAYARPKTLIEPFAGGAIVGLTAAFERRAERVVLVERDENVAAVWKTILGRNATWLARQILAFEMSPAAVQNCLADNPTSVRRRAFQAIVRNRACRGGIMAPGSGLMKHGENGKGIGSRWYPTTLARRILEVHAIRERLEFLEGDGLRVIQKHALDPNAAFFVDPPYTASVKKAGRRLYQYNELDHDLLFNTMQEVVGDFLMTYDDDDRVREMARSRGFGAALVAMRSTHHSTITELLIGKDVSWASSPAAIT